MNSKPPFHPPVLVWFCAATVMAIGGLVLLGWALDIAVLKSIFPGLVTLKAWTAVGLVLGGVALALLSSPPAGRRVRCGVGALALGVTLLGMLALGEHVFGWKLEISRWLVSDSSQAVPSSSRSLMAPSGAFCFVLVGVALFVACCGSNPIRVQLPVILALGAVGTLAGVVIMLEHAVETVLGFRLGDHTGMAVHTAAGFVLLGVGLIALARSRGEFTWSLDAMTTGGFAVGIGTLLITASSSYNFTHQMLQTVSWVSRTHEVQKEIQAVAASLANSASVRNAFLVTGDDRFLERRAQIKAATGKHLDEVRRLTADNPRQQRRVDRLETLVAERRDFAEQAILARQQHDFSAGEKLLTARPVLALATEIERLLDEMKGEEAALLETRQKQSAEMATRTFLLLPLGMLLSLTMLFLGIFFLNAGVVERKQAEKKAGQLAAFPERNPNPVVALDLAEGVVHYINPAAARLFPDLQSQGLAHPWLEGLPTVAGALSGEGVGMIHREVAMNGACYVQTICYAPETRRLHIYSSDITAQKRAQESFHELSARLLLAQDEERRRIARELHDSTAQELAAVSMNLGRLQESVEVRDPLQANLLADSLAILTACSRDIRTLSYILHPQFLDELGLAGALRHYVSGFSERSGLSVELDEGSFGWRLPPAVEIVLFRVVQESLANVLRHSGSTSAIVSLRYTPGGVTLEVADRGRGLPPEFSADNVAAARLGVGIAGMRERLRQLNGRLEFSSDAGGTTVRATVASPANHS